MPRQIAPAGDDPVAIHCRKLLKLGLPLVLPLPLVLAQRDLAAPNSFCALRFLVLQSQRCGFF